MVQELIGTRARPVKAILFDKTPASNWYVTWHQDLTIATKKKILAPGFERWTEKDGVPHVQPPASVMEAMLALRIHLDPAPEDNGAIKFIAGTHRLGILGPEQITELRTNGREVSAAADTGEIVAMRPLILHSSSQSKNPEHRRVLHIEYAAGDLPFDLKWAEASGLDSVELVMAIEEEFGFDIPDQDAEKITTVGEMFEYLKSRLELTPPSRCLFQQVFYKLRRALIENYGLARRSILPETILTDLVPLAEIEAGWPYLYMFIELKTPPLRRTFEFLGIKLSERTLTVGELVHSLISVNSEKLSPEPDTEEQVWHRLVTVIVRQTNVNESEIFPSAFFTKDLGIC